MDAWLFNPELLQDLQIRNEKGIYRVRINDNYGYRRATQEEIVRQLTLSQLIRHYRYPQQSLHLEYAVQMGVTKKRVDIAILDSNGSPEILIEVKIKLTSDSINQLQSYLHATNTKYGAVIALDGRKAFRKEDNGLFSELEDLPICSAPEDPKVIPKEATPEHSGPKRGEEIIGSLGIGRLIRVSKTQSKLEIQQIEILLSNKQLSSYAKLKNKAIEFGVLLPGNISKQDWEEALAILFSNATTDDKPDSIIEAKPKGEKELLEILISTYENQMSLGETNRVNVIKQGYFFQQNDLYFKSTWLVDALKKKGVRLVNGRGLYSVLNQYCEGKRFLNIQGSGVNCWIFNMDRIQNERIKNTKADE